MASAETTSLHGKTGQHSLSPSFLQVSAPAVPSIASPVALPADASTLAAANLAPVETAAADPSPAVSSHSPPVFGNPFTGFIGRSFLQFCLWVDMVAAFRRTRRATRATSNTSAEGWRHRLHVTCRMYPWLGTASCILSAAALTFLFYASSLKNVLPFAFLAIIALVATVFGREAGVLGTLTAALIFASVLFEPRPSLAMQDPVAQSRVIWMIVIGVVVSDLIGRHKLAHSGDVPKFAQAGTISVQKTRRG